MKLLSLLLSVVLLAGCYPAKYRTMISMEQQFKEECSLNTVASSIEYQDNIIKLIAVCTKEK